MNGQDIEAWSTASIVRPHDYARKLKEILNGFDFADMAGCAATYQVFLCRQTGKIYYYSDFEDVADLNEDLPDDIEDAEKYIAIPDRRELDLGKPLALDFAREWLPNDFDEVRRMFDRKGAYGNFRSLLRKRGAVDRWYKFESDATERALREWCEFNSIAVID